MPGLGECDKEGHCTFRYGHKGRCSFEPSEYDTILAALQRNPAHRINAYEGPTGSTIMLLDNAEVCFYFDAEGNLTSVRAY